MIEWAEEALAGQVNLVRAAEGSRHISNNAAGLDLAGLQGIAYFKIAACDVDEASPLASGGVCCILVVVLEFRPALS